MNNIVKKTMNSIGISRYYGGKMMSETVGRISVNDKTPTSRLQRYVEERVKYWLVSQEIPKAGAADYEVAFFDEEPNEDGTTEVSCLITVQAGETQWRSWETGETPQVALNRSLENMHIDMKH